MTEIQAKDPTHRLARLGRILVYTGVSLFGFVGCGHNTTTSTSPAPPSGPTATLSCEPANATAAKSTSIVISDQVATCIFTTGNSVMNYALNSNASWIYFKLNNGLGIPANSISGQAAANSSTSVLLYVTTLNLSAGNTYTATISLTSQEYPTVSVGFTLVVTS